MASSTAFDSFCQVSFSAVCPLLLHGACCTYMQCHESHMWEYQQLKPYCSFLYYLWFAQNMCVFLLYEQTTCSLYSQQYCWQQPSRYPQSSSMTSMLGHSLSAFAEMTNLFLSCSGFVAQPVLTEELLRFKAFSSGQEAAHSPLPSPKRGCRRAEQTLRAPRCWAWWWFPHDSVCFSSWWSMAQPSFSVCHLCILCKMLGDLK